MKVAEIVTNKIIEKLESGTIPWRRPWFVNPSVNYISQKAYSGVNMLMLDGGEYMTFKQAQEAGGHVKRGARAEKVIFYTEYKRKDEEDDEDAEWRKAIRYYNVFSLDDIEGLEGKRQITERPNAEIKNCKEIAERYIKRSGVKLSVRKQTNTSRYIPAADEIEIPEITRFKSSGHYYSTLFHEMIHSTGTAGRCNRKQGKKFGDEAYSREELVAEIGAAMLCSICGIDSAELLDNTAAYIENWKKAIQGDTNMILYAAAKAEKAVKEILA